MANPALMTIRCRTVEQMRLVNALSQLDEMGDQVRPVVPRDRVTPGLLFRRRKNAHLVKKARGCLRPPEVALRVGDGQSFDRSSDRHEAVAPLLLHCAAEVPLSDGLKRR